MTAFSPGQIAPISGQYAVVAPNGRTTGHEVTMVTGKPFPPAAAPGYTYVIVDPTKHKR